VTRWGLARKIGIELKAKRYSPTNRRSVKSRANAGEPVGSLRKGISASYARVGPLQITITLTSTASYSLYVIQGTTGPIRAKSQARGADGRFLIGGTRRLFLPPGMGYGAMRVKSVSGQAANDFLSRAVEAESVNHPALRGYGRV